MTTFRVTAESLGHQAIGAFRNMTEVESAIPSWSPRIVGRMEPSRLFRIERRVKDFLAMRPSKKEIEKEATR